jgi:hypothetical protein
MSLPITALTAGLAALLLAGSAAALPTIGGGRGPVATLYEGPNFQGRSITVYSYSGNMSGDFNDKAQSVQLQGRWRVCEDAQYRGRCQDLTGDVPDLAAVGMSGKISSLQAYFEGAWNAGWNNGDGRFGSGVSGRPNARPFEGATGVLFPYPGLAGFDLVANGEAANAFCRANGLGASAYYDASQRANQALDGAGRYFGDTSVLRDVFCRRR